MAGGTNQTPAPFYWANFEDLFTDDANGSFCQNSDEMKNWR
jgi:hypothetical protein